MSLHILIIVCGERQDQFMQQVHALELIQTGILTICGCVSFNNFKSREQNYLIFLF